MATLNVSQFLAYARANGGATLRVRTGERGTRTFDIVTTGPWCVGVDAISARPVGPRARVTPLDITRELSAYPLHDGAVIGLWLDGETLYVDRVRLIARKRHALRVARKRGELAIYNLATGRTVRA